MQFINFQIDFQLRDKIKTEIENQLMREVLYDYYVDKIEKFDTTKNYDYVMGYFGIYYLLFQVFFKILSEYLYFNTIVFLGILGCLDFKIFGNTCIAYFPFYL